MKTEIRLANAIGKTIKGFEVSELIGQVVILFTDDTYTTLGTENEDADTEVAEDKLNICDFGDEKIIASGIASKKELSEIRKRRKEEMDKYWRDKELAEFERLKLKFKDLMEK